MKVWKYQIIIHCLLMMMVNCCQKEVHSYIQLIKAKLNPPIIIQQIIPLSQREGEKRKQIMSKKKIFLIQMPLMMIVILIMKIYLDHKLMSKIVKRSQRNITLMHLMKIMCSSLTSNMNKRRLTSLMKQEKGNLKMLLN